MNNTSKYELDLVKRAEEGDSDAISALSELNHVEAARLYLNAANVGYAFAQNKLANILIDGEDGVAQDVDQAIHWYTESAKQGRAGAQYNLAMQYYKGRLIDQDYEKAMYWFAKAAEQGDADAFYYLGCGYFFEEGYPLDLNKGLELWEKAVEMGNTDATFMLALTYYKGTGVEENIDRAFSLFQKAADAGDLRAMHYLGDCFKLGHGTSPNVNRSFELYSKSAEEGNSDGQYKLALCYINGLGTNEDAEKAFFWFTRSAENGNLAPHYYLGQMYEMGLGTSENYDAAIAHYKQVPDADRAFACRKIGNLLVAQGRHSESWDWYLEARDLGDEEGKQALAQESFSCIGRNEQNVFAEWADKASENGSENAVFLAAVSLAASGDTLIHFGGDFIRAIKYLNKSKKWYEKLYQNDGESAELQDIYNGINDSLGDAFFGLGHYDDAISYYRLSDKLNATIKMGRLSIEKKLGKWNTDSERTMISNRHINLLSGNDVDQRLEANSPGYSEDAYQSFKAQIYFNLGGMYQWGIGVLQDTQKAYNSFLEARNLGLESAAGMLSKYKKKVFGGYEYVG